MQIIHVSLSLASRSYEAVGFVFYNFIISKKFKGIVIHVFYSVLAKMWVASPSTVDCNLGHPTHKFCFKTLAILEATLRTSASAGL